MTLAQLFSETYQVYKGKVSKVPAVGTDKYNMALSVINAKLRQWATDPYHEWDSLWQDLPLNTTIRTGVQDYDIDANFEVQRLSDQIEISYGSGLTKLIYLVKKSQRHDPYYSNGEFAYLHGIDPKIITFITPITSNTVYLGGSVSVPAYVLPTALKNSEDIVEIDNLDWLVYATAAELARNDPYKRDQYPNLQGLANVEWQKMCDNNNRLPDNNEDVMVIDMPSMTGDM